MHLCLLWCSSGNSPLQNCSWVPTELMDALVNPQLHLNVTTFAWYLSSMCLTRLLPATSTWFQGFLGCKCFRQIQCVSFVEPAVPLVKSLVELSRFCLLGFVVTSSICDLYIGYLAQHSLETTCWCIIVVHLPWLRLAWNYSESIQLQPQGGSRMWTFNKNQRCSAGTMDPKQYFWLCNYTSPRIQKLWFTIRC